MTATIISFCVAWFALDLTPSVLLVDLGVGAGVMGTEGNPKATPLLNKAEEN